MRTNAAYKRPTSNQKTYIYRMRDANKNKKTWSTNTVIRQNRLQNKGHSIMIKGSIKKEDVTLVNIYAHNVGAPNYIKQTLMNIKGQINSNTVIVGDFNAPMKSMDRSSDRKSRKQHP